MRHTILVLSLALTLFALACSQKESPSETATDSPTETAETTDSDSTTAAEEEAASPEPPSESAQAEAGAPPTITLITAGEPPLEKMRRQFKAGTKEVFKYQDEHGVEMKGGGLNNEYHPSGVTLTIRAEIKAVAEDGTADVAVEVMKMKKDDPDSDRREAQPMNSTGATGTYKINSQGVITDFVMSPPPGSTLQFVHFDGLKGQLRWMAPPFPEEAIGVGAKWTVDRIGYEHMSQMSEHIEVELVERTANKVALKFEVTSSGSRHHDFPENPQSIATTIDVKGRSEVNPNKLVPRSAKQETLLVQAVTLDNQEPPPEGFLKMTIDHTVKVKRKR